MNLDIHQIDNEEIIRITDFARQIEETIYKKTKSEVLAF
jgi:hypothetical protein